MGPSRGLAMTLSETLESPVSRIESVIMAVQIADAGSLKLQSEATWLSAYGWFFDTLTENLEEEDGGQFIKYVGDGALFVFGAGRVADAINAAILMQEAITAGNVARKITCHAAVG